MLKKEEKERNWKMYVYLSICLSVNVYFSTGITFISASSFFEVPSKPDQLLMLHYSGLDLKMDSNYDKPKECKEESAKNKDKENSPFVCLEKKGNP